MSLWSKGYWTPLKPWPKSSYKVGVEVNHITIFRILRTTCVLCSNWAAIWASGVYLGRILCLQSLQENFLQLCCLDFFHWTSIVLVSVTLLEKFFAVKFLRETPNFTIMSGLWAYNVVIWLNPSSMSRVWINHVTNFPISEIA
jgi:hypothetical protein